VTVLRGVKLKKIVIVGGGLGGLTAGILLAREGYEITLYEKKKYPFHRVCGEYISNEVKPFLQKHGLFPEIQVANIQEFTYSAVTGKSHTMPLDLGAFGVSRYYFDQYLATIARKDGVQLREGQSVTGVTPTASGFLVEDVSGRQLAADMVIGAYGKSSNLDRALNRSFLSKESPYIGVKYHIQTDFQKDLIALHNFESGYCGISAIEEDKYNMCYLGERAVLKQYGSIEAMEEKVLHKNPHLKTLFKHATFLFDKPEVINAFTFAPKQPVENGIYMIGDAAGLITPLCGNGMAMAIHSAKILVDLIKELGLENQKLLTTLYTQTWQRHFRQRLWVGRQTQKLFGTGKRSTFAVNLMKASPLIASKIMKNTHGEPFQ
jgi:flavin-dependent dehydrogenase